LISRRHCSSRRIEGRIRIADLESLNGTFVNGVPTREKVLEPGDRIKVGESQFIFLLDKQEDASATRVPLSDAPEDEFITATVKLEHDETIYFQPDCIEAALPSSERVARDLVALLRIGTAING